jgi:acid phosphatase class B
MPGECLLFIAKQNYLKQTAKTATIVAKGKSDFIEDSGEDIPVNTEIGSHMLALHTADNFTVFSYKHFDPLGCRQ